LAAKPDTPCRRAAPGPNFAPPQPPPHRPGTEKPGTDHVFYGVNRGLSPIFPTDGHAKNFSLHLLAGGRYRLTPLYDVLSAWPVTGVGPNHLDSNKLRLAMALRGKNTHYRIRDIQRRHFNATAQQCGLGQDMESIIEEVLAETPRVVGQVGASLPAGFPEDVFESITWGLIQSAKRLERDGCKP